MIGLGCAMDVIHCILLALPHVCRDPSLDSLVFKFNFVGVGLVGRASRVDPKHYRFSCLNFDLNFFFFQRTWFIYFFVFFS
jgi:hypothetical protein